MSTWPSNGAVPTTNVDESTDKPSLARSNIKTAFDSINAIINARAAVDGIPSLGSTGGIPRTQLGLTLSNTGGTITGPLTLPGDPTQVLEAATKQYVDNTSEFSSGDTLLSRNTVAPTGWTISTTHNNKALRVVSSAPSSGGTSSFSTILGAGKTTQSHTLTTAQMPSHTHGQVCKTSAGTRQSAATLSGANTGGSLDFTATSSVGEFLFTVAEGGGTGHSHNLSLDIQYVDVVIIVKT